jgi:lipid-A-disaccharide synthase-like uncharacterized protein
LHQCRVKALEQIAATVVLGDIAFGVHGQTSLLHWSWRKFLLRKLKLRQANRSLMSLRFYAVTQAGNSLPVYRTFQSTDRVEVLKSLQCHTPPKNIE